jgi:Family of unknown function (DUF5681)
MTDSYEVGFCKPPKATQFKPGQSGNPSGGNRKKMPTSLDEAIQQALEKKQTVMVNGKRKRLTRLSIISEQLIARAASGDAAAMRELMRYARDRARRVSVQQPDLDEVREVEVTLNLGDEETRRKIEERQIEEGLKAARANLATEQGGEEG